MSQLRSIRAFLKLVLTSLKPKTFLPIVDLLLVNVAVLAALWLWALRDEWRVFNTAFILTHVLWFPAISAVWLLVATLQDFYQQHITRQFVPSLTALAGIAGLLLVIYFAVYFFAPRDNTLPRGVILSVASVSFLFVGLWRLTYIALTRGISREALLAALQLEWRTHLRRVQSDSQAADISGAGNVSEPEEPGSLAEEVLTVQEVAEHLKVSQATIWRWCKSGKLPAFRVGQQWRIRAADLQVVIDTNGDDRKS